MQRKELLADDWSDDDATESEFHAVEIVESVATSVCSVAAAIELVISDVGWDAIARPLVRQRNIEIDIAGSHVRSNRSEVS